MLFRCKPRNEKEADGPVFRRFGSRLSAQDARRAYTKASVRCQSDYQRRVRATFFSMTEKFPAAERSRILPVSIHQSRRPANSRYRANGLLLEIDILSDH